MSGSLTSHEKKGSSLVLLLSSPLCVFFHLTALGWVGGESMEDWAMCCRGDKAILSSLLSFPSLSPSPPLPTSSQALFLLASPRARRGVRVGSICLCDGCRCQAPRGLEREERRLMWGGTATDVSGLSSGAEKGAEAKAGAGAGEREWRGGRVDYARGSGLGFRGGGWWWGR